jgi:hypothetical protein
VDPQLTLLRESAEHVNSQPEGDRRGYFQGHGDVPERMQLDLRFVTSVESPNGTVHQGSVVGSRGRDSGGEAGLSLASARAQT